MGHYGQISSTEVAVLCLLQKIMNEYDAKCDSCLGKCILLKVFAPKLVLN